MAENYTLAGIFGHHEEWKSQLVKDIQTIYDVSDTSDIPKVLKDLKKFYNEKEGCDVNIIVGNDPDTKAFLAHSFILKARSEYFRTALSATWVKKDNGMIIFRKPNISSQIFELILRYLYTAEIFKSNLDLPVAFDLMTAADELGLTLLVDTIQRRIITQSPLWEKRFFFTVFQASSSNPHLTLLYQHSLSKLLACRNVFIKSDDIDALTTDTMLGILQKDDIDVDELNLWKAVMTWAHKKIPNISTEPNDWSDEEIDCMKNLLHDIITHIHFVDLTATECNGIIEKYKKILPEGIVDALKEYHESPSKTIHQDLHHPYVHCLSPRRYVRSLILTRRQGHCLLNNIREFDQDSQPEYIPNVLALLERGTNFGFTTHDIQAVMNRTGQKVLVMKVKDSDEIIGCYTSERSKSIRDKPIQRGQPKCGFFFSFKGNTPDSFIYSPCSDSEKELVGMSNNVMTFGRGPDLSLGIDNKNPNENEGCEYRMVSHSKAIREIGKFSIQDYEMFRVLWRKGPGQS